jgi:hypothetical protein
LYELQNFANETEKILTEQYLSVWEDCYAEMEALDSSQFKNKEEYMQALQKIYNHYAIVAGETAEEMNSLFSNNADINAEYGTDLITSFDQTDLASLYGVGSFSELSSSFGGQVSTAINKLGDAFGKKESDLDVLLEVSGFKTWKEYYEATVGKTQTEDGKGGKSYVNTISEDLTKLRNWFMEDSENSFLGKLKSSIKDIIPNYN